MIKLNLITYFMLQRSIFHSARATDMTALHARKLLLVKKTLWGHRLLNLHLLQNFAASSDSIKVQQTSCTKHRPFITTAPKLLQIASRRIYLSFYSEKKLRKTYCECSRDYVYCAQLIFLPSNRYRSIVIKLISSMWMLQSFMPLAAGFRIWNVLLKTVLDSQSPATASLSRRL